MKQLSAHFKKTNFAFNNISKSLIFAAILFFASRYYFVPAQLKIKNPAYPVAVVDLDFYWIISAEGLFSHIIQLEGVYKRVVIDNHRHLILSPFKSFHYPDHLDWINLCDIFEFNLPHLSCTKQRPSQIVRSMHCSLSPGIPTNHARDEECVYGKLREPNIRKLFIVEDYDPATSSCFIGNEFTAGPLIRPKFNERYRSTFKTNKETLGFTNTTAYAVMHWRRGKYPLLPQAHLVCNHNDIILAVLISR